MADKQPVAHTVAPVPSAIVPRRGVKAGRRPNAYPDLDYQVVSAALGVHPTWLGRVLNGRFRPSMQMASKLAAYMGWTLDQVNAFYKPKPKPKPKQKITDEGFVGSKGKTSCHESKQSFQPKT